jgi:hypothetical protein
MLAMTSPSAIKRFWPAPLIGLLLYWRVPLLWFQNDDFAWLALPRDVRENGLMHALFTPFAQGTVRVLGDRLFFLTLSGLFGLHALAYRFVELGTWTIALTLIALIGERLTGSRTAGLAAAILWAANCNAVESVAWASAYDQLLCAVCLLAAFYSRLRGWRAAEWIFYLAGFGALEIAVMYPFLAALHAQCTDRKQLRGSSWLFAPAAAFTAAHFILIPKASTGIYALSLDSRLPATFANYLAWSLEPGSSALRSHADQLRAPELLLGMILGLALGWFVARCLWRREWMAGFLCGWFVLLLAPVLLLPNHPMPYYLTLPSIGLAWLAGWAIARGWRAGGWRAGRLTRVAVLGLAAAYFVGNAAGIQAQTRWFQTRSQRMHKVVEGVAAAVAAHPGDAIALEGVDDELYQTGFDDHPFLLVGAERVWRVPAAFSPEDGHTRVLEIGADGATRDITGLGN